MRWSCYSVSISAIFHVFYLNQVLLDFNQVKLSKLFLVVKPITVL